MKKVVAFLLAIVTACSIGAFATGCSDDAILVQTNAFFAPFEYYDGSEIVGVDVDMERVGEKMGKEVKFQDGDFGIIIQTVSEGKTADVGAAGLTITDERKQYVDFSIPYYTSVQYVIWDESDTSFTTQTAADGTTEIVLWENLKGKKIGVQIDTTGNIYVAGEINKDEGFDGVLYDSGATVSTQENAQLAVEAMYGSLDLDCVVVDKLPAEYLVANTKNHQLKCAALYYDAETATEEQYAICVTPGKTELLDAINSVLEEMIENNEIDKLVQKHLGLTENN